MSEYLAIKNWEKYQSTETSQWVKDYVNKDFDREFMDLSLIQKAMLDACCRLRARHGCNMPNDPLWICRAVALRPQDRHNAVAAIRQLIAYGWLIPTAHSGTDHGQTMDSQQTAEGQTMDSRGAADVQLIGSQGAADRQPMGSEVLPVQNQVLNSLDKRRVDKKRVEERENETLASDLPPSALATKVIHETGVAANPQMLIAVSGAVEFCVKHEGKSKNAAVEFLIAKCKDEIDRGGMPNKFWFDDRKWRSNGLPPPRESQSRAMLKRVFNEAE